MNDLELVGPLNVGKEERVSIKEISDIVVKISNKDINVEFDTSKDTVIWGQWCNCQEAKNILDWEAKTSLEKGIQVVYNDIKNRI